MKHMLLAGIAVIGLCTLPLASPTQAYTDPPPKTPSPIAIPTPDLGSWTVTRPTPPPYTDQPGEPAGDPGVAITPVPAPTLPPVPPPWSGWPQEPPTPTAVALYRTLVVRVCLDANANRWCDVDEGIAGVHVVIQDGETGMVRATSLTDRTGTAQRTLLVRADTTLTVNIPYLGTFHTFTGDRQPEPVLVKQVPPLPGLLP